MAAQLLSPDGGSANAAASRGSTLGAGFAVGGAIVQGFGALQANAAQAQQEMQNAAFYRQQAQFAQAAMVREMELADKDYSYKKGLQTSGYARGGVDTGSGSAALTLANTASDRLNTLAAIRLKGQQDYDLAMSRAVAAENAASELGSFTTQLITVAKSAAVIAGAVYGGPAGAMATQTALGFVSSPKATGTPAPAAIEGDYYDNGGSYIQGSRRASMTA